MNKIVRIVFTLNASFFFMFWVFIAFLLYLPITLIFKHKKDRQFLVFLYDFIGEAIVKCSFLRVEKKHHASYCHNESYVVVSNHQAMMDIPANVVGAPNEILFKFLGKQEAARIPFFGFLINRLCILVDRKNEQSRKSSYARMKKEMDSGYSVFVYPEGTRNRTDALVKEFYDGAFRLAIEMQKPIVVNTLVGIKELNPPKGFFTFKPGTIQSHWDEPIATKGKSLADIPALKKQIAEIMVNRLQAKF